MNDAPLLRSIRSDELPALLHGVPTSMNVVYKACPCVFRKGAAGYEVLAFKHPLEGGWQIPKGTIEDGEDPAAAAIRELEEESGVRATRIISSISVTVVPRENADHSVRTQIWHLYHLEAPQEVILRECWTHSAEGSVDEQGLLFAYSWIPVSEPVSRFDVYWHDVLMEIRKYCERLSSEDLEPSPS